MNMVVIKVNITESIFKRGHFVVFFNPQKEFLGRSSSQPKKLKIQNECESVRNTLIEFKN